MTIKDNIKKRYAFIIGGINSGCGKTTVTLGLIAALRGRGYGVQPFKCGPDYIDTGLHGLVAGVNSRNLDVWMCGDGYVKNAFLEAAAQADISIVEGVMGFFDGGGASTAYLSRLLGLPVVLVMNAKSMAQSAAAIVKGFETFEKDTKINGIILNNIGSSRHFALIEDAIKAVSNIKILGYIPVNVDIALPQRHLGLHTAEDNPLKEESLQRLVGLIEDHVDIPALLEISKVDNLVVTVNPALATNTNDKVKIAIARDAAFCFYYVDNLELLRRGGAELRFFSPISDSGLPDGVNALYLGGGYPENYAKGLSKNQPMLNSIKEFIENGGVTYAECGGFMYLTKGIRDFDNNYYPMVGIYPVEAKMKKGRVSLGYRQLTLIEDTIIGKKADVVKGHEFHYSDIAHMPTDIKRIYNGAEGTNGFLIKNCLSSYVHLHFASNENIIRCFIEKTRERSWKNL
ncbi:MAG: cobyrinate a,c-diamide synthase [Candidatus Magnetoovum sp. WYHC-5]|nr:cobyrinate a,c-diamide synthase [Candidatus Magnetoovum sp. WYHC-5]